MCDKTCIFCFFPIINKYLCMAKRSLLSRCPSYFDLQVMFLIRLFGFNQICNFSTDFRLSPQDQISQKSSSGSRADICGQTEERTNRTTLIGAFRDVSERTLKCVTFRRSAVLPLPARTRKEFYSFPHVTQSWYSPNDTVNTEKNL